MTSKSRETMSDHKTPDLSQDSPFTRRDFLMRAGQIGAALSVAPLVGNGLLAQPAPASAADLANGILTSGATSASSVAPLSSALKWRMLGPFRGGRTDAVSGVP